MKILLNKIKPSSNPIRKTRNEEKMDELVQSIKEQGIIVPIKVRQSGDNYEVVYGHRRIEAARKAGLKEIECMIEGVNDDEVLIQALIENVIREDMNPADKSDALNKIKELTGKTWEKIGEMFGWSEKHVKHLAGLKEEEKEIMRGDPEVTLRHIEEARRAGIDEIKVLRKTQNEVLSTRQVGKIAKAISQSPNEEVTEAILKQPVTSQDESEDILRRANMITSSYNPKEQKEEAKKKEVAEIDKVVKAFLDAMKFINDTIVTTIVAAKEGRFSSESAKFSLRKIEQIRISLDSLEKELKNVSNS